MRVFFVPVKDLLIRAVEGDAQRHAMPMNSAIVATTPRL
jgi:hypothetical protein